jgi:hypothetical protein
MSLKHFWIFISSVLLLGGCANTKAYLKKPTTTDPSYTKIYNFPYDQVWRAAQLSLRYPLSINNMDAGKMETDYVRAVEGYQGPTPSTIPIKNGTRYKILVTMLKGKIADKDSVRVTVIKKIEDQKDFFSEPSSVPTDGIEEKILLYRIDRELNIDDILKKNANAASAHGS